MRVATAVSAELPGVLLLVYSRVAWLVSTPVGPVDKVGVHSAKCRKMVPTLGGRSMMILWNRCWRVTGDRRDRYSSGWRSWELIAEQKLLEGICGRDMLGGDAEATT